MHILLAADSVPNCIERWLTTVGCLDVDCPGGWLSRDRDLLYFDKDEAVERWNSRAERTCEMEPTFINPQVLANIQEFMCTACGRFVIVEQLGDDDDRPNYCPNCGARVS